jgi:hypothetical protein
VSDPYNTADGSPRGFVRAYYDLEPELSDFANARAKELRISKREYIRRLIIRDHQEQTSGKQTKKRDR